ncbi:MAG TPA: hypothetical protein EYP85_04260 [Armatimonadetes bacterium]|nr:hypothetical protein [Armatimonadota bacterium]
MNDNLLANFKSQISNLRLQRAPGRALLLLALLGLMGSAGASAGTLSLRRNRVVLANRFLERRFHLAGRQVRTVALVNRLTGQKLTVNSAEFVLRLGDDRALTGRDFCLVEQQRERLANGQRLTFTLRHEDTGLEADLVFTLGRNDFFLRKQLRLRGPGVLVKDVEVEHFTTGAETDLGGFGQPLFLANCHFLGLEYPAGYNLREGQTIALRHYPGAYVGRASWTSKTAVWGVAPEGQVKAWFRRYVGTFRRPPRSFIVYNSWYDLRRPQLTPERLLERAQTFQRELRSRGGPGLDAVVVDDGWQNRQSIWGVDRQQLPQGWKPLTDGLEALGTHLGLWLPLTATAHNLDVAWGAAQGYEVGNHHYCLAGPRYRAALQERLREYILHDRVVYFKHDFNNFRCEAAGHGHLPAHPYGFEAGVDGALAVYEFMRNLRPDLYLNPSGGMWLSPWWLRWVDTVWMQFCRDFGWDNQVPAWEPRDRAMTYRDGKLWRNLRAHRFQFPVSAVMTIGIIDGQLNRLGGEHEPFDRWANNVILNLGRGSMLKELYLTPARLDEARWRVLAEALAWAEANQKVLAQGEMLPGNPEAGEVYGYAHFSAGHGFVCLRNPSLEAQRVTINLAAWTEPGSGPFVVQTLYPYRFVQGLKVAATDTLTLTLGPYETQLLSFTPRNQLPEPALVGCRASVAARGEGETTFHLWGEPGERVEVEIVGGQRARQGVEFGPSRPEPRGKVEVIGQTVRVRVNVPTLAEANYALLLLQQTPAPQPLPPSPVLTSDGQKALPLENAGPGWRLLRLPLRAGRHLVTWPLFPVTAGSEPFGPTEYWWSVWLWAEEPLVARELTVPTPNPPPALPTPHAGRRCRSLPLMVRQRASVPLEERPKLRPGDWERVQAARLRICVFGVQDLGDRPILLNGVPVGLLPLNSNPHQPDFWEEHVLELPPEAVAALKVRNEITFAGFTHLPDCCKFTALTLAVQRPDGRWVRSNTDTTVYCNVAGWLYTEGVVFPGDRPPRVELTFPLEE